MSDPDAAIVVNDDLTVPLEELQFHFVRSSGPGGQQVNRSATQVELTWDVACSPSLSSEQRARVMTRLRHLIDGDGVLHLSDQSTRSQYQNRMAVLARLRELLISSQSVAPQRIATRPGRAARRRRVDAKRRHGLVKRLRRAPAEDE